MDSVAGVYFPRGGMHAVPAAMALAVEKAGGEIRYGTTIDRIVLEHGSSGRVRGVRIDLQSAAAQALQQSIDEAAAIGLTISALDGPIAGGRSYGDTLMLWNSRVFPALSYWMRQGRLNSVDIDELGKLDLEKKVEKILEWESRGIYFSTDRSRSILTSTAPPGTSQHLSLLAFDVVECWDPQVRSILNRNGWFQTVIDDPGHFTYLGLPETELPSRGLTAIAKGGYMYWIPNMSPPVATQPPTN
jgi:hypothetical protein